MIPGAELASWLRLALTPGLGPVSTRELLQRYGHPERLLALPRAELATAMRPAPLAALDSPDVDRGVSASLDWASRAGNTILTLVDPAYPRHLLEIADPPIVLFVAGRVELLHMPSLAIVGSRNATPQGRRTAEQFAQAFSEAGLTIASGLALGIDASAHAGALAGPGSTVAVLGTGIDILYPRSNAVLGDRIRTEGALVSEFPLGTSPAAGNFPRRNRLISGLSLGCLVVEAAVASGSLITARAALEQGREVFAVPGSIHSPVSRGCHALIKSGAKLVENAQDVLSELRLGDRTGVKVVQSSPAASGPGLLREMGYEPVDIDTLCERTGCAPESVSAQLLALELAGEIESVSGGRYQRISGGDRNV